MANDNKVRKLTKEHVSNVPAQSTDTTGENDAIIQRPSGRWGGLLRKRESEFDRLSKLELEDLAGDAILLIHWHQLMDVKKLWEDRKKIVFPPSSHILFVTTALFYTVIMYNWFAVLYRISFAMNDLDVGSRAIFILIDLFVDLFSILECFVSARTGFLHQGTLVSHAPLLWRHYKNKWLLMDVISLLPIHFIGFAFSDNVYAWLRVARLVRIARWNEYWGLWGGHARNANLVRLVKIIVIFFMIIHIFGSVYFFIVYHEGYGSNNWVAKQFREDDPGISRYLFGLFWAGSFMTGSNYAEPATAVELYFSLIMMLVGVLIFAAVIANIGGIFSQLNRIEGKYRTKMSQLDAFMRYRQLGRPLQTKIKNYYEYMWSRQQGLNDEEILKELPSHLHTQVALDLTQDLIKKVPFFQGCPEGFLASLVVLLKPQIYAPGDFIIREGEIGKEMFFLSKGVVEVQAGTFRKKLDSGSIFGEIAVLFLGKRTASIVAVTYCDVYVLQKEDLDGLLPYYPEQEQTIREVAAERYARTHSKDDEKKKEDDEKKQVDKNAAATTAGSKANGKDDAGAAGADAATKKPVRKASFANVARMLTRTKSAFGQRLQEARERRRAQQNISRTSDVSIPGATPVIEREHSSTDISALNINFEDQAVVQAGDTSAITGLTLDDLVSLKGALTDVMLDIDAMMANAVMAIAGEGGSNLGSTTSLKNLSPGNNRRAIESPLSLGESQLQDLKSRGGSLSLAEKNKGSPQRKAQTPAPPTQTLTSSGNGKQPAGKDPPLPGLANTGNSSVHSSNGGPDMVSPRAAVASDLPKSLPPISQQQQQQQGGGSTLASPLKPASTLPPVASPAGKNGATPALAKDKTA